jgi:hypothetical protein
MAGLYQSNGQRFSFAGSSVYTLVKQGEKPKGVIEVPSYGEFGFIKLFEKNDRVSVFVSDIERCAEICLEHLGKKLTWEHGSLLYFYHLKLEDETSGKLRELNHDSDLGNAICSLAQPSRETVV